MTFSLLSTAARVASLAAISLSALIAVAQAAGPENRPEDRNVYFGETHLHTVLSFDAYIMGNRNGPDEAYRYARGEAIPHPGGFDMQLKRPLDFQAVTDHAIYLGMLPAMHDPDQAVSQHPIAQDIQKAKTPAERLAAFQKLFPRLNAGFTDDLVDENIMTAAWQKIITAAEKYNDPGKFTTFIAFEYTSGPDNQNLHRNVFFRGGEAPTLPYSRIMSPNPEDLWQWMDDLRETGVDTIAVPHNSNGSNGLMFMDKTFDGKAMDADYAATRMRNEPIVEVTQVKGDSEAHPLLSPNDEWADFEIMPFRIGSWTPSQPQGSYVREAYLNGLKMDQNGQGNPYKFGLIGASDTHVGAGAFSENNYWSKVGLVDATGKLRGAVPLDEPNEDGSPRYSPNFFQTWSASGLAAVWAEENTRDSLFDAMRRKETYATTGPRIRLRFFAGTNFDDDIVDSADLTKRAYAQGVSMGSDLALQEGETPEFLVWAIRDPDSANLQRLQIVKGWIDAAGDTHEQVIDIACAGGVSVDAETNHCPDNNASVDIQTCAWTADTGDNELKVRWRDDAFDAAQKAFYYVRVLENPTCRWSTWDAMRAGVMPRAGVDVTIQERAYSSPIWVD